MNEIRELMSPAKIKAVVTRELKIIPVLDSQ